MPETLIGWVTLLVIGVPLWLASFAVALFVRSRLRGPSRLGATAFAHSSDAVALRRLDQTWRRLSVGVSLFVGLALIGVAGGTFGTRVNMLLLVMAPMLAALLGMWVVREMPGRPFRPRESLAQVPVGRADAALLTGIGALAVGLLVAGQYSAADPDTGWASALGIPSIVDWSIGYHGAVIDVQYADGGVTRPWPGWHFGIPMLLGLVALVALILSTMSAGRPDPADPDHPFDATLDTLERNVARLLAAIALDWQVAWTIFVAGSALASTAVIPLPRPNVLDGIRPFTYAEPLHTLAVLMQGTGVLLAFAAIVGANVAVLVVADLHRTRGALSRMPRTERGTGGVPLAREPSVAS